VPPQGAYNSFPRFHPETRQLIAHLYQGGPAPQLVKESRGAGAYTLCGPCNQRCSRYAREFIEWSVFWQTALDSAPAAKVVTASSLARRSRLMKQIVAMVLSASPPKTGRNNDGWLRCYAWNAELTGLPLGIHAFVALTRDQDARQAAGGANVNMETGAASVYTEIAFAPFILVMTFLGSAPPDDRLVDISHFASAGYKERQHTQLTLPVLRLHGHYPGTYL
jgi:HAMP domain-containing protein